MMDLLANLRDKLQFIEWHYAAASAPFREIKRKIDDGEKPFERPPFDAESATDLRPPFLKQWQEANESLNIEGQLALRLVQNALREYLSSFINLYGDPSTANGKNWLRQYRKHLLEKHGIDWEEGPVPLDELGQVSQARNDVERRAEPFSVTQPLTKDHELGFPVSRFVDEIEKQVFQAWGYSWAGPIEVTDAALKEAIRRVETLSEFLRFETVQKPLTVVDANVQSGGLEWFPEAALE
jgi:hypothetical protein